MAQTVANLLIKFESDTNGAVRGINRVEASLGGVEQRTNSVGALLGNFGRIAAGAAVAGVATLGAAMAATAVDGTKMAMDLEAQMSAIAATMQRSREEIEPLKGLILSLGMNPNLKVSTMEAAEAIDALANNGVKMTEILEGAAEATVLLSNATGGKFAGSADIMSDVMKQFKESAGSYTDAVNGIVAVTSKSKFTIDDYGLAIAQAGGVASSVGVEFGDFNTTLAAISPLFGSGSDAGTSFKTMLQTLIPKSDGAAAAMEQLGLIAADGSNAFFDAQGNLKSMADVSAILQGALAGLSEEQKNATLSTIFGTDAMRAAVALADSGKVIYTDVALAAKELGVSQEALNGVAEDGITAFEALQVQMGQVDALEAAKTRMDNTSGALEILGGIIETVKIQIGDAFLPTVRQLAETLGAFVTENQGRIVALFAGFAAGVGLAAAYIPTLLSGVFSLAEGLGGLWAWLQATIVAWQPFIAGVLAVVQPVIGAVVQFVSWKDILIVLAGIIGGSVVTTLAGLVAAMAPVVGAVLGAVAAVAVMRNAWENDWGGVRTAVLGTWEAMQPTITALQEWLATTVPAALTGLQATWEAAWPAISGAVTGAWATMQAALDAIKAWIDNNGATALAAVQGAWETAWPAISGAVTGAWATMQAALDAIKAWIDNNGATALAAVQGAWEAAWPAIAGTVTTAWTTMQAALDALRTWLTTDGPTAVATLQTGWAATWTAVSNAVTTAQTTISTAWNTLVDLFGPSVERVKEALGTMTGGLGELGPKFTELQTAISNMVDAVTPIIQTLGGVIAGILGVGAVLVLNGLAAAFEELPDIIGAVIDQVTATIELIATTVRGVTQTITALFQGDFAGAWEGIKTVVGGVDTYIGETLGNWKTLVESAFKVVTETIGGTFTDLKAIVSGFGVDVDGAIAKLTSLGEWIKKLFTGDVALNFAAPEWLTTLLAWAWPDFIVVPDWVATLLAWSWPLFITQPGWVLALVAWSWPAFISQPSWVSDLVVWEWPYFSMPEWLERLFNWSWPTLPKLPSWLGGSNESDTTNTTNGTTTGTTGGGRSLVGAGFREPVAVGGGGVQIVINANVANQLDIEDLAYRVAAIIQRRRG